MKPRFFVFLALLLPLVAADTYVTDLKQGDFVYILSSTGDEYFLNVTSTTVYNGTTLQGYIFSKQSQQETFYLAVNDSKVTIDSVVVSLLDYASGLAKTKIETPFQAAFYVNYIPTKAPAEEEKTWFLVFDGYQQGYVYKSCKITTSTYAIYIKGVSIKGVSLAIYKSGQLVYSDYTLGYDSDDLRIVVEDIRNESALLSIYTTEPSEAIMQCLYTLEEKEEKPSKQPAFYVNSMPVSFGSSLVYEAPVTVFVANIPPDAFVDYDSNCRLQPSYSADSVTIPVPLNCNATIAIYSLYPVKHFYANNSYITVSVVEKKTFSIPVVIPPVAYVGQPTVIITPSKLTMSCPSANKTFTPENNMVSIVHDTPEKCKLCVENFCAYLEFKSLEKKEEKPKLTVYPSQVYYKQQTTITVTPATDVKLVSPSGKEYPLGDVSTFAFKPDELGSWAVVTPEGTTTISVIKKPSSFNWKYLLVIPALIIIVALLLMKREVIVEHTRGVADKVLAKDVEEELKKLE